MAKKAMGAVRVSDLDRSVDFYRHLGFTPCGAAVSHPDCTLVSGYGLELLLAGPGSGDIADLLNELHRVVKSGDGFPLIATDFAERRATLASARIPMRIIPGPWGDAAFVVMDPDNVAVTFLEITARSDEETLDYYLTGVQEVERALAGVGADAIRAPGKWTNRQIAHHVVDGDIHWLSAMHMALIFPGQLSWTGYFVPDTAAATLGYAERPIEDSVAFLGAIRRYVAQMVRALPGALDRTVALGPGGVQFPVRHMLTLLGGHARHHAAQVAATRIP